MKENEEVLVELEDEFHIENQPEELVEAKPKKKFLQKLEDGAQRKALKNIARFFALMLILTLVARGTAGATLAIVETAVSSSGEIVEKVKGSAVVNAANSNLLKLPEGMRIEDVMVTPGQKIEKGDAVLKFDPEEVVKQIQSQKASLKEMQAELKQLTSTAVPDLSAIEQAKTKLEWAQQDLAAAGIAEVADAQNKLTKAQEGLEAAQKAKKELAKDAEKEKKEAATQAVEQARKDLENAQAGLQSANDGAGEKRKTAERDVENSKKDLETTQQKDAEDGRLKELEKAQNGAKAEVKSLDIDKQNEKINLLEAIDEKGNFLAEDSGIVTQVPELGAKTESETIFKIADANGGYVAKASMPKNDAKRLEVGMEVEVSKESSGYFYNPSVQGKVIAIAQEDEQGNVEVSVKLPEDEWKQASNVDIKVILSEKKYEACVPLSALHQDSNGYYILTMESVDGILGVENKLIKTEIEILAKDENQAAIQGEFGFESKIVKSSTKSINEGDKVRVKA